MSCKSPLVATLSYPNPAGKSLSLNDTYACHTVGCAPNAAHYAWFWCPALGGYIHGGIDVHGKRGDRLAACYTGKIIWLNWGPRFGRHQFGILAASGVLSAYMHTLSRPAAGLKVVSGQKGIAKLGDESFNANGTINKIGAHLHLTVVTDRSDPVHTTVNPYKPLLAAKKR